LEARFVQSLSFGEDKDPNFSRGRRARHAKMASLTIGAQIDILERRLFMARLAYPQERDHPELAGLIAEIRDQRGGRLANLYKMLLKSPPVAAGWLHLLTAIRQQSELRGQARELAILRVPICSTAGRGPFSPTRIL
jgi:hypothetical protein